MPDFTKKIISAPITVPVANGVPDKKAIQDLMAILAANAVADTNIITDANAMPATNTIPDANAIPVTNTISDANAALVQSIFASIAHRYDRLNTVLSFNLDQGWRKKAIEICALRKNQLILDVCCGTGRMMEYACKAAGKGSSLIGLDFSEEMLRVASAKLAKALDGYQYSLVKGDVLELPFADKAFDRLMIAFGLRNIADKAKALSEMYRVLKAGGKLVCLELSRPQTPIIKDIYYLYLNYILPSIGYLGTRNKQAYQHLNASINGFLSKAELKSAFDESGFQDSGFVALTWGTAAIHYGSKPS